MRAAIHVFKIFFLKNREKHMERPVLDEIFSECSLILLGFQRGNESELMCSDFGTEASWLSLTLPAQAWIL